MINARSIAARALWILESRLADPPSLADLAEEIGVSPYAVLRAVLGRFGQTPMAYARRRRLSLAAQALVASSRPILDIALEAGYSAHASFTRAFREAFDQTPEAVRANGLAGLDLARPPLLDTGAQPIMAPPQIEDVDLGPLIGLRVEVDPADAGAIPALWGAFAEWAGPFVRDGAQRLSFGLLDASAAPCPVYACAAPADAFDRSPPGFVRIDLRPRRYAVVSSPEHVSRIRDVWRAVWDSPSVHALGRAVEATEIERYGPAFDPHTGAGGFSLMIPLEAG